MSKYQKAEEETAELRAAFHAAAEACYAARRRGEPAEELERLRRVAWGIDGHGGARGELEWAYQAVLDREREARPSQTPRPVTDEVEDDG